MTNAELKAILQRRVKMMSLKSASVKMSILKANILS